MASKFDQNGKFLKQYNQYNLSGDYGVGYTLKGEEFYFEMNKPKFIMMIGLPCAGKSTYSKELAKKYDTTIFSSDALRAELFGDINEQGRNTELFTELHKRIKDCLKAGKNAIYDACNHHKRRGFLQELKNIPCEKIAVIMATPYEDCLKRATERERKVPEYVIKRMYTSFEMPWYSTEGWDDIQIKYSEGSENSFGIPIEWINSVMDFNQDNPHHTLTLGKHCLKASELMLTYDEYYNTPNFKELLCAALLHDESKPFVKSFVDSKGNPSDIAHFYSHHNCSAYNSLFYDFLADHLYVATLIQWHMQMHFNREQKTIDRYRRLWGEELYKDLCILHQADLEAH